MLRQPTTNPLERLNDLKALRDAVQSHRSATARVLNDKHYRVRRAKNAIERIRSLRVALGEAMKELRGLYYAPRELPTQIDLLDKRLKQLDSQIVAEEQRTRVQRLLKLKAQMEAMNATLPEAMRASFAATLADLQAATAAPAEPDLSEDPDDETFV